MLQVKRQTESNPALAAVLAALRNGAWSPVLATRRGLDQALRTAANNQVVDAFARALQSSPQLDEPARHRLNHIVAAADRMHERLARTLRLVDEQLGSAGIVYRIAKTWRPEPFVTWDVDVLVMPHDWSAARTRLQAQGALDSGHRGKSGASQTNLRRRDLLTIDLHGAFTWMNYEHGSPGDLWAQPARRRLAGRMVETPPTRAELALLAGHVVHERGFLTLLDLMTWHDLASDDDVQAARDIAAQASWRQDFDWFVAWVDRIGPAVRSGDDARVAAQVDGGWPALVPISRLMRVLGRGLITGPRPRLFESLYVPYAHVVARVSRRRRLPYFSAWLPKAAG